MSSITFKFKKDLKSLMEDNYQALKIDMAAFTAKLLNKKEEEIIVDFEEYQIYEGKRDILVRAETSRKNIELLNDWATGIKEIIINSSLNDSGLVVGVKTYITDSCWQEFELK